MTREEAIEVYHGLINTKIKEAFEFFAPELAESEDERIRKELIDAFEVYDIESLWNQIPVKHILAWLEKQKGQMNNYISKETVKRIARGSLGVQDFMRKIDEYKEDKE